jgi:hypothetical protein
VHNNFGGGFVSDEDRVALSSIKFASAESAGAKCISSDDGQTSAWLEASMEQLCVPLPPWSLRAGARETIWFNPADVNAASKRAGGRASWLQLWSTLCLALEPSETVDQVLMGSGRAFACLHSPTHTPHPPLAPCPLLPLPLRPLLPAVVTCGGLCPGLNDVVQGLVSKLTDYGVPEGNVVGIRCAPAACPACLICPSCTGLPT